MLFSQVSIRNYFYKPFFKVVLISLLLGVPVTQAAIPADQWVDVTDELDPLLDNLSNIPQDAHTKGMWSSVGDWPIVSVHAMLMPNGKVLSYGTDRQGNFDGRYFDEWDPSKGFSSASHLTRYQASYQNSFCSTAVFLPQGDVLIAGGDTPRTSTLYATQTPSNEDALRDTASNMAYDRWYPTMITLPSGQPLMLGGMVPYKEHMGTEVQNALNSGWASMTPEIYNPDTETWTSLFGATSRDAFGPDLNRTSYPRAWVAPNGKVFGVSADKMWWLTPDGDGSIAIENASFGALAAADPENIGSTNTAAMFDIGKILVVGGNGRGWFDGLPASKKATVIDINSGSAVLDRSVGSMTYPRRMAMATVLPTGQVVVLGGTTFGFEVNNGVYAAEIWNPATGNWSLGSDASVFKSYHSNATLLANGSILFHGGGFPIAADGLKGQIYYPPYLFKAENGASALANRPQIKAISGLSYRENSEIQLDMVNNDAVSSLVLVGLSNGTHAFNPGQRRIPLAFTQDAARLSATLPNYHLTPPGYYQVVAINQQGVPSKGVIIGIGNGFNAPTPPINTYTPPSIDKLQLQQAKAGDSVNYNVLAVDGVTYSWNFGDGTAQTPYSTNTTVSHTFSQPGVYLVTLSANDHGSVTSHKYLQAVLPNTTPTSRQPTTSSQLAYETVANGDNRIWAVNPDNDSVSVINAISNTLIKSINVGKQPSSVAIAPDGNIWVSNKQSATLSIINRSTLAVADNITLDHASQPHGLAFSPNLNQAFVVLEATGELIKLDTTTKAELGRVNLGPHIRHVSVNHNTSQVFVSRFITPPLPGEATADVDTSTGGGEVVVINPSNMTVTKTITLRHSDKADTQIQGAGIPNYLGAVAISPDNTRAWVPSKQDNIKRGTLRSSFELNFQNTVRAISSNINLSTLNEDYAKRIDHDNSSLATAAIYHPNGVYAFVTLETSREVAVVDAINGLELFKFDTGRAPQALTLSKDGKTLYVKAFMDRSVSVFDLTSLIDNGSMTVTNKATVYSVPLNQEKLSPSVLLGKQLFYDAKDPRLAKDSYMSCASCHDNGGHDGRVWDLTGFGEGLRNTIALKGKAGMGHGFLHWSANFDEVQDFEGQIRALAGGTGLMSDAAFNAGTRNQPQGDTKAGISTELDELAAYVSSLNTFDNTPYGNANQSLTANALAGKAVFTRENCMACHASPLKRTNSLNASNLSNIGTITATSGQRLNGPISGIDVPTLRNLWQTAPYLHDGRALSLNAAIDQHSGISLSNTDRVNLVQYLLEIDNDTSDTNVAPTVSIRAPQNASSYQAGQSIQITADANDTDGIITAVAFFDGATSLGTDTQAPYQFTINNAKAGTYALTAVATDNAGLTTTSNPVNIQVQAVPAINQPPLIAITAPGNNAVLTAGESTSLQVNASDPDGQIASVTYYRGSEVFANITTKPFSHQLQNLAVGQYTISAKARDNAGAETTSAPITITVKEPVVTTPTEQSTTMPKFSRLNANGQMIEVTPTRYSGPVDFLEYQMFGDAMNDVVFGSESNDFINLLGGDDAANGGGGRDVLDGGTGSNFLTGGSGNDTFFIDGRGNAITWSTIADLSAGDTVNLWGYIEGVSRLVKIDSLNGAEGYKGITYHYDLNNDGMIEASVTFSGKNANSNIVAEAKTVNGTSPYLLFYIAESSVLKKAATLPSTDDTPETVVQTTNTASLDPSPNAIFCAKEFEYCSIPNGQTATVWYGAIGGNYLQSKQTGRFKCSADTFGGHDPNIGLIEYCSYLP